MKKTCMVVLMIALLQITAISYSDTFVSEVGVRFGMTPQEVEEIEPNKLNTTYTNSTSYQLNYSSDVKLHSLSCTRMEYDFDVQDKLLFQMIYVAKGGESDYRYLFGIYSDLYGNPLNDEDDDNQYSLFYEQLGKKDNHIESAHWIIADSNLGIDLWYNEYDTVFALLYDVSNPASYGDVPFYYTDETGITFQYMNRWQAMEYPIGPSRVGFAPFNNKDSTSISYMQMDLWEGGYREILEPLGYKRENLNAAFLEDDIVRMLMEPIEVKRIETVRCGSVVFRVVRYQTTGKSPSELFNAAMAMTMKNGYLHAFMLGSLSDLDEYWQAYNQLLETVTFSK